jgi:hypothetical protein
VNEDKAGNTWLRALVSYISKWIDASSLASDSVPVVWVNGPKSAIHGSPNQKWLQVAAGILTGDQWWLDFALQRYANEFKAGHQEGETLTGSHAWQHLTAHAAIRYALRATKPLMTHAPKDTLAQLEKDNSLWWANEAFLMKQFYSREAKGCVSVGARNQPPGFCRSSQKDAIASYIVGSSKRVPLPKHLDGTDVYCQVLADRLVSLGDDLSKDNAAEPKLYSPVYVQRKGDDVRSYWTPPQDVTGPAYYAEAVNGKTDYRFETFIPPDRSWYKVIGTK